MIVILSDDCESSMHNFLTDVSKKLDEDKPSKIAVLWETDGEVMLGFHRLNVSDIQHFSMAMLTEGMIRAVAYNQDYIESLQSEDDDE